ncbi:MAG: hypothetical protein ACO1OQ_01135 [Rufibacter sp.]
MQDSKQSFEPEGEPIERPAEINIPAEAKEQIVRAILKDSNPELYNASVAIAEYEQEKRGNSSTTYALNKFMQEKLEDYLERLEEAKQRVHHGITGSSDYDNRAKEIFRHKRSKSIIARTLHEEMLLEVISHIKNDIISEQKAGVTGEGDNKELSFAQIGLLYNYLGIGIDKDNANEIAKKFGKKSGEKLIKWFNQYFSSIQRTSSGQVLGSGNKQRVKDLMIVIDKLEKRGHLDKMNKAKNELKQLKDNIMNAEE